MKIKRDFNGMTLSIPLTDTEIHKIAAEYNREILEWYIQKLIRGRFAAFVAAVCPERNDDSLSLDYDEDDIRFQAHCLGNTLKTSEVFDAVANKLWDESRNHQKRCNLKLKHISDEQVWVYNGKNLIMTVNKSSVGIQDWSFVMAHWDELEALCNTIWRKDDKNAV